MSDTEKTAGALLDELAALDRLQRREAAKELWKRAETFLDPAWRSRAAA